MSRLKPFFFCLPHPFGAAPVQRYSGDLTANPIEFITHFTGDWTLIFLLGNSQRDTAAKILGWNDLIKLRRMLGLFAFFYALLHFSTYLVLDHFFDCRRSAKIFIKRPYVTAGFTAFVLMFPLAITSTAGMIRRLGKRWQQLHRLVYVAAIAGVIHFYWLVKADIRRPAQYGFVLALLLVYRILVTWRSESLSRLQKPGAPARKSRTEERAPTCFLHPGRARINCL